MCGRVEHLATILSNASDNCIDVEHEVGVDLQYALNFTKIMQLTFTEKYFVLKSLLFKIPK